MRGTPATKTWSGSTGSTQTRPNHHPYVDCDEERVKLLGTFVQESPLSFET